MYISMILNIGSRSKLRAPERAVSSQPGNYEHLGTTEEVAKHWRMLLCRGLLQPQPPCKVWAFVRSGSICKWLNMQRKLGSAIYQAIAATFEVQRRTEDLKANNDCMVPFLESLHTSVAVTTIEFFQEQGSPFGRC